MFVALSPRPFNHSALSEESLEWGSASTNILHFVGTRIVTCLFRTPDNSCYGVVSMDSTRLLNFSARRRFAAFMMTKVQ